MRGRRRRPPSTSDEGVPSFTEFLCVRTLPPDSMDDLQPFSYLWSSYIVLIATHTHTHQSIRISGTYHVVIKPPLPQPPPTPFFAPSLTVGCLFVYFSPSLCLSPPFSRPFLFCLLLLLFPRLSPILPPPPPSHRFITASYDTEVHRILIFDLQINQRNHLAVLSFPLSSRVVWTRGGNSSKEIDRPLAPFSGGRHF